MRSVVPSKFDRALSRHLLHEGGIDSLSKESLNDAVVVACAECFENEGLRLDAAAIGRGDSFVCPRCSAIGGAKLTKQSLAILAHSFFVKGSVHRTEFGAAPLIMFNDKRQTDIGTLPGWPSGDAALFEEILRIGFFWYGPPDWQVGINENLAKIEQEDQREQVVARILETYPTEILTEADKFYRLRKVPGNEYALDKFDSTSWSEFDSSPLHANTEEAGRLDSPKLPVLYGSSDIQTCLHECRVTVEDALFLATLRPVRELKLLNLVSFPDEPVLHPCEDLDHAMVMLFLAGPHAYPTSRAIACAACDKGFDGLIYPSFFSMLRNGVYPFESYFGLSVRSIPELRPIEGAKMIPNLAVFGRPIQNGVLTVTSINRVILRKAAYSIHFGPAGL